MCASASLPHALTHPTHRIWGGISGYQWDDSLESSTITLSISFSLPLESSLSLPPFLSLFLCIESLHIPLNSICAAQTVVAFQSHKKRNLPPSLLIFEAVEWWLIWACFPPHTNLSPQTKVQCCIEMLSHLLDADTWNLYVPVKDTPVFTHVRVSQTRVCWDSPLSCFDSGWMCVVFYYFLCGL